MTIDTPSHLFLAGVGMIPTHNSGSVQFGALQSKTPYIGPLSAFEMNEKEWATANVEDYAYLAYNDWVAEEGEAGRPVEKPTRQEAPNFSPLFAQGMQDAEKWSMMVTGQYQSQMGQEDVQAAASGNMSQFIEAYAANAVMQPLAQDYTNMVQQNAAFTTAVAQQTQVNQIADAYNPLTAAGRQNIVNAMSATDPNLYATLANGGPLVPSAEAQQAQGVLDNWLSTGATRAQVAATVLAQNGIPTPLQQEEAVMTANTVPSTHP